MNYIELINHFWRLDEQVGFNGNETRLYFYLLNLANRGYWEKEWFEYGDDKMKVFVGISADVLRTARANLKQAGLIDFIPGGHGYRVKTRYKITTPNPVPNREAIPTSTHKPLYNKTKNKINVDNSIKDERYSKREFITSGSDFDE